MAAGYCFERQKQTGAAPMEPRPRPDGDSLPARALQQSAVIDVDVDLVGNVDVRRLASKAEIGAEEIQQDEHDDDQQDDGKTPPPPPPPVSTTVVCSRSVCRCRQP